MLHDVRLHTPSMAIGRNRCCHQCGRKCMSASAIPTLEIMSARICNHAPSVLSSRHQCCHQVEVAYAVTSPCWRIWPCNRIGNHAIGAIIARHTRFNRNRAQSMLPLARQRLRACVCNQRACAISAAISAPARNHCCHQRTRAQSLSSARARKRQFEPPAAHAALCISGLARLSRAHVSFMTSRKGALFAFNSAALSPTHPA